VLTILGARQPRFCDGTSRRTFLKIGALGFGAFGGLSMDRLLRAQSQSGSAPSGKSVIMIYLPGGPTQLETFDPKPDSPSEIRGSFRPALSRVPGVQYCELLPKLGAMADKFSVVRTLTGMQNRHESFQCYTGRPGGLSEDGEPAGGWPALGSVASRLLGPSTGGIPPYIDASPGMTYAPYRNRGLHEVSPKQSWPGFTGRQHTPFSVEGDSKRDMILNGIDRTRLESRRVLLTALERSERDGNAAGLDNFQRQAFEILTSGRLFTAMDLEKEDPKVRARYGDEQPTHPSFGGAPQSAQRLLQARRLVEAGARCVTVAFGAWDWHANREGTIEQLAKKYLPVFDHAVSTLIADLDERGLLSQVSVVVWGEFGRTPRINEKGGRDHWPGTQSVLLAGGGIAGGRVVGQTDPHGGTPVHRPVHVQEVFATLYRTLGIDVTAVKIPDRSGRPRYLVDENRQPIEELA
jgi:hypothetical protein